MTFSSFRLPSRNLYGMIMRCSFKQKNMKSFISRVSLIALFFLVSSSAFSQEPQGLQVNQAAPDFTAKDQDDRATTPTVRQ